MIKIQTSMITTTKTCSEFPHLTKAGHEKCIKTYFRITITHTFRKKEVKQSLVI